MHFDPTAYCCGHCKTTFPADEVGTRDVTFHRDQMHDRPLERETGVELFCPFCGSVGLEETTFCFRCHAAAPQPGGDFCAPCEAIVESAEQEAFMLATRPPRRHRGLVDTLISIATGRRS